MSTKLLNWDPLGNDTGIDDHEGGHTGGHGGGH